MFPNKSEVKKYLERDITVIQWNDEVKEFIKDRNDGNLMHGKECIFIAESKEIELNTIPRARKITIIVSLPPYFWHKKSGLPLKHGHAVLWH